MINSVNDLSIDKELKLLIKDGMIKVKVVKINKGEFYYEENDLTYEEAVKELEEILEDLEKENLSLNKFFRKI